jgi:hypothetical protein
LILERQCLRIGDPDVALQALELEAPSHERDGVLGQVDACDVRTCAGELDEVGSKADADLEHVAPP